MSESCLTVAGPWMAKKKKKTAEENLLDRLNEIVKHRKMSPNQAKLAFNLDVAAVLIDAAEHGKLFIIRFDIEPGMMWVAAAD